MENKLSLCFKQFVLSGHKQQKKSQKIKSISLHFLGWKARWLGQNVYDKNNGKGHWRHLTEKLHAPRLVNRELCSTLQPSEGFKHAMQVCALVDGEDRMFEVPKLFTVWTKSRLLLPWPVAQTFQLLWLKSFNIFWNNLLSKKSDKETWVTLFCCLSMKTFATLLIAFYAIFFFNVNGKSVTSRSRAASDISTLNNSSCESVMHQRSPHPCKNVRACQWIHKSSTIHMDALCDHMFHAFLSSLTLYCSAHLLISLRMPDDVLCSLSTGFSRRPWVLSPQGEGLRRSDDVASLFCSICAE